MCINSNVNPLKTDFYKYAKETPTIYMTNSGDGNLVYPFYEFMANRHVSYDNEQSEPRGQEPDLNKLLYAGGYYLSDISIIKNGPSFADRYILSNGTAYVLVFGQCASKAFNRSIQIIIYIVDNFIYIFCRTIEVDSSSEPTFSKWYDINARNAMIEQTDKYFGFGNMRSNNLSSLSNMTVDVEANILMVKIKKSDGGEINKKYSLTEVR